MNGNYSQINIYRLEAYPARFFFPSGESQAQEPVLEEIVTTIQPTPNNFTRSQHNAQLPISRLPPELLIDILVRSMDHFLVYKSALRLSHVCHHWRVIMVTYPPVWSTPDFSKPLLAREMIQRSKPGPLDIEFIAFSSLGIPGESLSVLTEALAEPPRIRSFRITSCNVRDDILQNVLAPLVQPMPSLRDLTVHAYGPGQDGVPLELPPTFFSHAPNLKKVRLRGCKFPWEYPIPANITSLHLDLRYSGSIPLPTTSQFLQALAGMPFLEYLFILDSFPIPFSDRLAIVGLPHLRELRPGALSPSQAPSSVKLLSHISFPSTTRIWMDISYNLSHFQPSHGGQSSQLLYDLFGALSSLGNVKSLQLLCDNSSSFELKAWFDSLPSEFIDQPFLVYSFTPYDLEYPPFGVELDWEEPDTPLPAEALIDHLVRSVSLTSLDTLRICMSIEDSPKLLGYLAGSKALGRLVVGRDSAYGLLSLPVIHDDNSDEALLGHLPFPALRELVFYGVDFRWIHPPLFPVLLAALEKRPEKLHRLVLQECENLTHLEVERLRGAVIELDEEDTVSIDFSDDGDEWSHDSHDPVSESDDVEEHLGDEGT
ncbi:hypothetical protein VNI00_010397 [Paramarasmius palmivorus]|uniref:F-box domain-containing protein n=1 Tax=Paramarasmius palmivorus TaxID=297713 RepID=A0AAW0CH42_9AGAR